MSEDQAAPSAGAEREPTQEEFAMALAERLARTPVRDVIFQCTATFIDMATIRLGLGPVGAETRDMPQARQAIEAARALTTVAERELGAAQVRPFREPLAQLQMAYARMVEETAGEGPGPDAGEAAPAPAPPSPSRPAAGPDPASRLWVPPGTRG